MKRTGNLIESAVSLQNLQSAFVKASKGKRTKPSVLKFAANLDENLLHIAGALRTAAYRWGPYEKFKIYDPKEREIKVAPLADRIAHHALMTVCEPVFERFQIFDSYASRIGKGQFAALERAKTFCRKNDWFLKLDIRKYFDSIEHHVLKEMLSRQFKDVFVLHNFYNVIDSYCPDAGTKRGVPIGNLTSQFFANHYLAVLDHFIKEQLAVKCYVRYMDDFVLWGSRETLMRQFDEVKQFVNETLRLELKPEVLNRTKHGLPFLGFRVYPDRMTLSHRSRYRFRRKLKIFKETFDSGGWNELEYARHLETLFAYIRKAKTERFRVRVMQELGIEPYRVESCQSRRFVEQQCEELPVGESEQEHA
jgi:retron-type reverse transcriptase